MIDAFRRRWTRFAAAVCLTVATIVVGFAHRPLPGFPDGAALVEAGGVAFGGICVAPVAGSEDAAGGPAKHRILVCPACLLFAAPGLGAVADVALPPPVSLVLARVWIAEVPVRSRPRPRASARGPPGVA